MGEMGVKLNSYRYKISSEHVQDYYIGKFLDRDKEFLVDKRTFTAKQYQQQLLKMDHPLGLQCWIDKQENIVKVFYERYDNTYTSALSMLTPVVELEMPTKSPTSGSRSTVFLSSIAEDVRSHIQTLTGILSGIHVENICTEGFDMASIVVKGGKACFIGVDIIVIKKASTLEQRIKKDFKHLHAVLDDIFFDKTVTLPPDMIKFKDLCSNLPSGYSVKMPRHVAVLSDHKRVVFFEAFQKRKNATGPIFQQLDSAISKMNPNIGWKSIVPLDFEAFQNCLHFRTYDDSSNVNESLTEYIRNLAVHLRHQPSGLSQIFTGDVHSVSISVMHLFAEQIFNIQEIMFDTNFPNLVLPVTLNSQRKLLDYFIP